MTTRKTTRSTDDAPFDFNLDTVKAEVELTPFRVHFDGRRWEFTHMQALDAWSLIAAAGQGELHATIEVFKAALGKEQFAEFRKLPLPQFKATKLFDAYAEHSGVDAGESQGSTA